MKKIIIYLLVGSNIVFANAIDFDWKFASLSFSTERENRHALQDLKKFGTSFRLGVQNNIYRSLIQYKTDFEDYSEFTLETDYMFDTLDMSDNAIRPYVGVSLGYIEHTDYHEGDVLMGVHVGILLNISEDMDMDLSYAYKKYRGNDMRRDKISTQAGINYFF